jgi:hypothetical protein
MSRYHALAPDDALRFLKARDAGDDIPLDDVLRTAGQGDPIDSRPIRELEAKLKQLRKRFPATLRNKDPAGGKFESQACEIVHQCLDGYEPQALADHDFWTYLAVARFSDTVEWRFGARNHHAKPANYGIGSRTENLFFRLWLRADLGRDQALKDQYSLAKSGDQDLWRSHILRQGYANARPVAKALLKLQAGLLKARKLVSGDDEEGVRKLAKVLRRIRANVELEFLSGGEADELVVELCTGLKAVKS